jgi:ATP-dependent protease HslVU (ClpYQ) peptidase subunit
MTCTIGLIHEGVTYIGADSLGSNGYTKKVRNDKKLFKSKDIESGLFGFAGSYRMGQLLMYANGLLDRRDEQNINHEYLVTKFIPNVRSLFQSQGFERNNSGEAEGGVFILGIKDKLYGVYSDYQVAESSYNYLAMGSGECHALGSLHTTEDLDMKPEERIIKALLVAQEFAVGVEAPFYIMNTKDNTVLKYDRNGSLVE